MDKQQAQAPRTVSQLFPSRFVTAEDLHGQTFVLTVREVTVEKMRSRFTNADEWKAVCWFEGAEKGLVVNKTQALALQQAAGSEVFEEWAGVKVALSPTVVKGKHTIQVRGVDKGT